MDALKKRRGRWERPRSVSSGERVRSIVGLLLAMVLVVRGWQQPATAQEPAAKAAPPAGDVQSLSAHYRFLERYTDDPAKTDLLNNYQVGYRETVKITREKAQGAPESDQLVVQTIYTECVAKLAKDGQVAEVVRRFDRANRKSTVELRALKTKPLEGLNILYRLQAGVTPQILSLITGRQLRQSEFDTIVQQTFLPALTMVLPRQPARVGDTWPVARGAAWALLGSQPSEEGFDLTGEILAVRKNTSGTSMTAVIGLKGQCLVEQGPSGINAVIHFTFEPSPAQANSSSRGRTTAPATSEPPSGKAAADLSSQGNFDALGYISKISMAQEVTQSQAEGEGRLKERVRRELLLERRISARSPGGGGPGPLIPPNPLPSATMENSWLIYDDPEGRFHLLHPQEMRVVKQYPDGGIDLLERRLDGQDVITINLLPKSGDPQRDRLAADPIQEKKRLDDQWKRRGEKVLPGTQGWLPDSDWSKLKRKVYRIEAALLSHDDDSAPASGRIYLDRYIVQFARDATMMMTAMTTRDPHVPFREKAESMIKTFELGPSDSSLPAAPAPTPGAAPPARR